MFYNPPTTEVFYKTESYTLNEGDHGNVVTFNSPVTVICSIPKGLRIGFSCTIVQEGAGKATFAALGSGNQINAGAAGVETKGSFSWAKVLCIGEGYYTVDYGADGGGGTPG